MDLTRILMTLVNRLDHAEARLNFMSPSYDVQVPDFQDSLPWNDSDSPPLQQLPVDLNGLLDNTQAAPSAGSSLLPDNSSWSSNTSTTPPSNTLSGTDLTNFFPEQQAHFDLNDIDTMILPSTWFETGNLTPPANAIPSELLSKLHATYFEVIDLVMPIVNPYRFYNELAQSPKSFHVQALSYAVATLGAIANPEFASAIEACYTQARTFLDECERQDSGAALGNINTLQACVLLCFYELKHPNFPRAWMTLGRAIRMSKIMGLEKMDADSAIAATQPPVFTPLAPVMDAAELEERRRPFWQLYILDGLAGMRENSVPAFDSDEISVLLPRAGQLTDIIDATEVPTLQQALEGPGNVDVSSFAGTVMIITLYRLCFQHSQASLQDSPSYSFWDNFYRIDRFITRCRATFLAPIQGDFSSKSSNDPLLLLLYMNLATVDISLHEAAITVVEKKQMQSCLTKTGINKCQFASKDIVKAVRAGLGLTGPSSIAFRQSTPVSAWAITRAIRTHLWMLVHDKSSHPSTDVNALRVLSSALRELVDPSQIRPGLLEHVDAKLSEMDDSRKRLRLE